jgi:hypothetical protein
VETQPIPGSKHCLGLLDVEYNYRNPPHPASLKGDSVPFRRLSNSWVLDNAQGQKDPNACYAAALASAFASLKVHYQQNKFRDAISNECFGLGGLPLTFSQIVFAATWVHLSDGGIWYVDPAGQPLSQYLNALSAPNYQLANQFLSTKSDIAIYRRYTVCQNAIDGTQSWTEIHADFNLAKLLGFNANNYITTPLEQQKYYWARSEVSKELHDLLSIDLYRGIEWHSTDQPPGHNGGIYPIRHTGNLVHEVAVQVPVLAGLSEGNFGHVVLVSGLSFYRDQNDSLIGDKHPNIIPDDETYIEWVEVVDPANLQNSPYKISGNEFLNKVQFMFSIYQPR